MEHADAFGNKFFGEGILFVQRGSQFRQDRGQLVRSLSLQRPWRIVRGFGLPS
jgi:hypothetical protein